MAIRMEEQSLRKSHRISLPAKVIVNGHPYSIRDWSLEGFKAEIPAGIISENWAGHVTFILPLQHMDLSFDAEARLRRQGETSAGFSFDSLPTRSKALLATYIKASIEGHLDDIDGMIARVEASVTPVETDKPLSLGERKQFKRSFLGRSLFYLILGLFSFGIIGFILFMNFSMARSTRGVIAGGLIDVAPELGGFLTEIAVEEGQEIKEGELLFSLDDHDQLGRVEDIRYETTINEEELKYLYVLLQEEIKSMGLYRKAAKHEVEKLRSEMTGLQARIDVAEKEFERADQLIATGAISRSLWDERKELELDLKAQRSTITEQLLLAEENVKSAKDGKYLTDGRTRGEIHELEAKVNIQKKVIEQARLRLSRALATLEKTRVLSKTDGVVYAVKRVPGTFLRPGESVMSTLVTDAKPWVLARFTFEEAERLAPGSPATVYIPSIDQVCQGTVQALGHHAMGSGGVVSQDKEISLSEVPVKVILHDPPANLYPGLGVTVRIDTPWLRSLKALL